MVIGLNLLYLLPGIVGGTETYAVGLLRGLAQLPHTHDYLLFVNREAAEWASHHAPTFRRIVCPVDGVNRAARYRFEQMKLPGLASQLHVDVLHSLGYTSPLRVRCPSVVTVHDLNFATGAHSMPIARRLTLEFFVGQAIRKSSAVITVSKFSRDAILRRYRISPSKVVVIYEAALGQVGEKGLEQSSFLPAEIRRPYCVAMSSVTPNKNIPTLLRAFLKAKQEFGVPHQLVLVGHRFPMRNRQELSLGSVCRSEDVVMTGYVERRVLESILGNADFFLFPSLYEGFGLPVLEAMALGVPVVCSRAASLPEVGGEAALYFDPMSVDDIAEKIGQIVSSERLREELRSRGFVNVQHFSWTLAAQETIAVYERIHTEACSRGTRAAHG